MGERGQLPSGQLAVVLIHYAENEPSLSSVSGTIVQSHVSRSSLVATLLIGFDPECLNSWCRAAQDRNHFVDEWLVAVGQGYAVCEVNQLVKLHLREISH